MNMMHYQSLTNEKKVKIDMPDEVFLPSSISQLTELNRTRRIVLLLTGIQFVSFVKRRIRYFFN